MKYFTDSAKQFTYEAVRIIFGLLGVFALSIGIKLLYDEIKDIVASYDSVSQDSLLHYPNVIKIAFMLSSAVNCAFITNWGHRQLVRILPGKDTLPLR